MVDDFYYECPDCGYITTDPLRTEHDCCVDSGNIVDDDDD